MKSPLVSVWLTFKSDKGFNMKSIEMSIASVSLTVTDKRNWSMFNVRMQSYIEVTQASGKCREVFFYKLSQSS